MFLTKAKNFQILNLLFFKNKVEIAYFSPCKYDDSNNHNQEFHFVFPKNNYKKY